jgi:recombination protein RecA
MEILSSPLAASSTCAWSFGELAGRLVELCGWRASANLSFAMRAVLDAQRHGELAAWIATTAASFFPPDAVQAGVDLDALAVVRVPALAEVPLAADVLARSGAFGLIVLDLEDHATGRRAAFARSPVSLAALTRLSGLARKHGTAILFVSEKSTEAASLGSLVSLRADARRTRRSCEASGAFSCELAVAKDKRRGAAWRHAEVFRGPAGLH